MRHRKDSPMIIGYRVTVKSYVASDVPAILKSYKKCLLYWKSWRWRMTDKGESHFL